LWDGYAGALREVPVNKIEAVVRDIQQLLMKGDQVKMLQLLYNQQEQLIDEENDFEDQDFYNVDECVDHISGGEELKENMPRKARLRVEQKLEKIRLKSLLKTKTVIAVTEHMHRLRVKWWSTELSADKEMGDCRL
jgi:hypothetical protein